MYVGKPQVPQGAVVPHGHGVVFEPTRLGAVINSWLQKEVGHHTLEEVRRRDGIVGEGVGRGPFYTPLFLRHKTLSTPPVVQQLKAQAKTSWEVRVFTQILRSAAVIDEKCFLWNYETGRDPVMYEASSVITCLDLIKPKPGVFEQHVHYLLVICTFTTIELVAIHIKDPHRTEIKLQKLPEYQLTTGSTVMQCIATFEPAMPDQDPRIFIGGNDGCVYELQYKEEDGWIRSKMFLQNMSIPGGEVPVVSGLVYMARDWTSNFLGFGGVSDLQVDSTRNYLYSLDSRGYVHFWWLGHQGEAILKQYQCKVHVGNKDAKPVSIHVIPRQKNTDHEILCVLLQDGSRILFSATNNHDGRQRQLVPPRGNYNSDLGSCPVKTFSLLPIHQVDIGPLHPTFPMEQLGHLGPIDDAPGRSFVGAKVSLLIPKEHQNNPQLICTASLGVENSQGNVLSIVDLQPLVRQADTWRKGEIPTTGINIFGIQEEEWAGSSVQTSSSDLITQVVRPPPRFLVAHSVGVTFLTRLRPVDLLHVSLFHPQPRDLARQLPGMNQDQLKQLDLEWLVNTYGKVEVSVMLLTLICSDARPSASQTSQQQAGSSMAGPIEESIANMLASRPTHTVVQRAQEQLNKMGYAGHAGLFQYFVRAASSLWTTSFLSPFWEQLWSRKQFTHFVAPLEGLQQFLSQLVSPAGDYQHVWNPSTDFLATNTSVAACMLTNESFTDIYEQLSPQNNGVKPDPETLKMVEALSRRGLYSVVERTVQALKILRALEDLTAEQRQSIIVKIRGMELGRVVSNYSPDESEAFTDALMGELLQLPHGPVDKVWSVWRQCKHFFDPAAVDFYEARKLILSPMSKGNTNVIQEALKRLERPEVAHCLLRRQNNQETASVRLQIICEDLRRGKHYLSAMHLAMVAAKHCDPENRAEDWHMATAEPDALHGVDTSGRADLEHASNFFNARRVAYNELTFTLDVLFSNGDMDVDCPANSIRAQRTSAIEWALGPAAAKYFDSPQKGLARPILAGELFKSTDRLLHFHLYTWLIRRYEGDAWPSRCDIQRIRPYRSPQQTVGDSLTQFLSAGHYRVIIKHPLTQWTHQLVHAWCGIWQDWHIGLLSDLADYCESMNEGGIACCVRLTLAHASSAMYQSSTDFGQLGSNLLTARMDVLVKAEASAQRDSSTMGRQLDQWLQSQKPSAVAGVQLEMLTELPKEAWDRRIEQSQEIYAQADQQELQSELVPAPRLYEMLHDSYDESVPHLAIKLLRIMGIERPELKHIFTSTSGVGPWKISDFVIKVIQRHLELIEVDDQGSEAIVACFDKLQDAAGIDQGMVHYVMQPFLPLPIVLSGLEEMAMKLLEKRGEGLIPVGALNDPKQAPVSIVPGIVGGVLGWPNSHVLYDGYRMLWTKIEKAQIHDLFPMYAEKDRRAVVARLMAILGQFCLQWLDRHQQDIIHPQSDFAFQQLTREYPVFSGDIEEMALAAEHHVNIPDNVRFLIDDCKRRLCAFSEKINTNQPQGRRRDKW